MLTSTRASTRAHRVMLYCHDTYGLGHLTRTLALARSLQAHNPAVSQLIVTGSPVPNRFSFPAGTDFIKLPSVVKIGADRYESRGITAPFDAVRDLRRAILLSAARYFRPDALIVDHAPAGCAGEIVPALRYLSNGHEARRRTRLILGLRDIVDEAPIVRRAWAREGVYDLLDDVYDRILVYGQRDVYDVVAEYGLSAGAAAKTRYVGYLRREPGARSPHEIRAELCPRTGRLVVVTAGGGNDGYPLFRAMLDGLRARAEHIRFDCLLVVGPLMSAADRGRLLEIGGAVNGVHLLDFSDDMASYIAASDVVVSMGGYNTVGEILSFGRRAIIVPRVTPRREQLLRAEALTRRGLVRMIHPSELSPGRLIDEITDMLERPAVAALPVDLNGLLAVAAELDAILLDGRARAPAPGVPCLHD
jgi:predicted glycosyltransferase